LLPQQPRWPETAQGTLWQNAKGAAVAAFGPLQFRPRRRKAALWQNAKGRCSCRLWALFPAREISAATIRFPAPSGKLPRLQFTGRRRPSVPGFGAPGKLSGGQFSAENGRTPWATRRRPHGSATETPENNEKKVAKQRQQEQVSKMTDLFRDSAAHEQKRDAKRSEEIPRFQMRPPCVPRFFP
jgi:hypothetical protein